MDETELIVVENEETEEEWTLSDTAQVVGLMIGTAVLTVGALYGVQALERWAYRKLIAREIARKQAEVEVEQLKNQKAA